LSKVHRQTPQSFWQRVDMRRGNKCHTWTGPPGDHGYGIVKWNGRVLLAHRVAAWLSGLISDPVRRAPDYTSVVMHSCGNKLCCNPDHLILAKQKDNIQEQYRTGRRKPMCGEDHPSAQLTNAQAKEMKQLHKTGASVADLMDRFGVSKWVVQNVIYKGRYRNGHSNT